MERVAVIIVNFNSGPLLKKCLAHLHEQTVPPDDIIVVDNASLDGSVEAIERYYPKVQAISSRCNLGFAAANNLAVQQVKDAKWIALLNPDAFPEPRWLECLLRSAQRNPEYSFFGSCMLSVDCAERVDGTGDVYHVSGMVWRRDRGELRKALVSHEGEIFSPCAAAALYRRKDFLEVGGFDESYFCYLEDVDLAFRLRLLGHRCLYVPDAVIHHVGSAITGKHSKFSIYHGHRNLVWTFIKNMPWPLLWIYLPQHILLNMVTVLWFTLRGQRRIIFKAKRDALRWLPRVWQQRKAIQARRRVTAWELRRLMDKGLLRPYLVQRD